MIIVTGKTFEHRDWLMRLGARWNKEERLWQIDRLPDHQLKELRRTVGLIVNVYEDEAPEPTLTRNPDGGGKSNLYGDDPTFFNYFAPQNPRAFFGFSTLGKFIDYVANLPRSHALDSRRSGWEAGDGLAEWIGSRDMPAAIKIARQGWQEGARAAREVIDALALANPRVRHRRASVAGGAVNVGRMLSGDPAHMIHRPKSPGKKIVTLFVEAGCAGHIDAATLVVRAAIIGAITDLMENAGYSCTIVVTDTSVAGIRTFYQLAVTIKESGERMNIDDLIFALGHPSFLRRFSFATCSSVDECRDIWSTQGEPSNAFTPSHPCRANEFYIPVMPNNPKTINDAMPFVIPKNLPITIESFNPSRLTNRLSSERGNGS